MSLLEAKDLRRRHPDGKQWLLDHVSLGIDATDRWSLAGPSGSGKTLLLRALAMLDPLDGGQLRWQGRPLRHDRIPCFRSATIYLHQRASLLEENVETALRRPFSLAVHRRRQFDRERIVAWLERLGRDHAFLQKNAADLSGGEIQIVALLRALQLDPTILLLDEPTAALDSPAAAAVEQLLGDWVGQSADGRAFVWVTHDADQAQRVGQRILAMREGRLVDSG
jgi:putative ABC transport system ATP-binding protein